MYLQPFLLVLLLPTSYAVVDTLFLNTTGTCNGVALTAAECEEYALFNNLTFNAISSSILPFGCIEVHSGGPPIQFNDVGEHADGHPSQDCAAPHLFPTMMGCICHDFTPPPPPAEPMCAAQQSWLDYQQAMIFMDNFCYSQNTQPSAVREEKCNKRYRLSTSDGQFIPCSYVAGATLAAGTCGDDPDATHHSPACDFQVLDTGGTCSGYGLDKDTCETLDDGSGVAFTFYETDEVTGGLGRSFGCSQFTYKSTHPDAGLKVRFWNTANEHYTQWGGVKCEAGPDVSDHPNNGVETENGVTCFCEPHSASSSATLSARDDCAGKQAWLALNQDLIFLDANHCNFKNGQGAEVCNRRFMLSEDRFVPCKYTGDICDSDTDQLTWGTCTPPVEFRTDAIVSCPNEFLSSECATLAADRNAVYVSSTSENLQPDGCLWSETAQQFSWNEVTYASGAATCADAFATGAATSCVCKASDITTQPTNAPSPSPTDAPTNAPSPSPTDAPSDAPTDAPSDAPTDAPTYALCVGISEWATAQGLTALGFKASDGTARYCSTKNNAGQSNCDSRYQSGSQNTIGKPCLYNNGTGICSGNQDNTTWGNCDTAAPTDAPTGVPTDTPTSAPTAPTLAPTSHPTSSDVYDFDLQTLAHYDCNIATLNVVGYSTPTGIATSVGGTYLSGRRNVVYVYTKWAWPIYASQWNTYTSTYFPWAKADKDAHYNVVMSAEYTNETGIQIERTDGFILIEHEEELYPVVQFYASTMATDGLSTSDDPDLKLLTADGRLLDKDALRFCDPAFSLAPTTAPSTPPPTTGIQTVAVTTPTVAVVADKGIHEREWFLPLLIAFLTCVLLYGAMRLGVFGPTVKAAKKYVREQNQKQNRNTNAKYGENVRLVFGAA